VALRLKSGAGGGGADAVTARVTVVEWLRLPLEPVTVRVEVPTGVAPDVVTDSVDMPPFNAEKFPVAPVGRPLTLNETGLLKPLVPVT
jgi:hypothetical protein